MTPIDIYLFVSHVSEDRLAALQIVDELERRGVRCWIAPRDVRPGRPFDNEIGDAIDGCRAMLLIFSERCNDSDYIRREITVAGDAGKIIIPFRIEDALPKRGLRVRLADLHWVDAFVAREAAVDAAMEAKARERAVADVIQTLGVHERPARDSTPSRSRTVEPTPSPPSDRVQRDKMRARPSRRALLATGGGVAALGIGGTALWLALSGHDKRTAAASEVAGDEVPPSPELIRTLRGHLAAVRSVAFSPDGRMALSGSFSRTFMLWDIASGQAIRNVSADSKMVLSVAFSPDGRSALTGGFDKTLKLWDIAAGDLIRTFFGHSDRIFSVALSPDGRRALSGSDDKALKLWDVATGEVRRTFSGHSDRVDSVAFSPDGQSAVSGSSDQTVKLWDTTTGATLRTFSGHSASVRSVAFSPDGRSLLSGSGDDTLKL